MFHHVGILFDSDDSTNRFHLHGGSSFGSSIVAVAWSQVGDLWQAPSA